jgi:hypothetical protein
LITPEISSAVNEAATEAVFNEVQPEPDSEPSPLTAEQDAILDRLKSPNPLVRDLAEKAQENLQRRIAAGLEPDLDPRRTGRGPPPRGYKVG